MVTKLALHPLTGLMEIIPTGQAIEVPAVLLDKGIPKTRMMKTRVQGITFPRDLQVLEVLGTVLETLVIRGTLKALEDREALGPLKDMEDLENMGALEGLVEILEVLEAPEGDMGMEVMETMTHVWKWM